MTSFPDKIVPIPKSIIGNMLIILEELNGTNLTLNLLSYKLKHKLNIVDTIVESWGYDIDLSEFSHSNYMVIKSAVTGKTYFMVYIVNGTYVELDLEKIKEQNDIRSKLGLAVSNSKYE